MSRIKNMTGDHLSGDQLITSSVATPLSSKVKHIQHRSINKLDPHLVSLVAPESVEAEQYRVLRYEVEHLHEDSRSTMVGICSALPGDGKTITAINLAGSLAQDSTARVLLIEVDLRRPAVSLGDRLALGNAGRGLVDAVMDPSLTLGEVVHYLPHLNLSVLPAGKRSHSPYEILKSPRLGELLSQARERYDYLILDAPPIIPVPDCRLIADWVDGFFMVVAAHRTPREALEEALTLMNPATVLGLVFNGYDRSASRYYGYGYT